MSKNINQKNKIRRLYVLLVLYRLALDACYLFVVSKYYSYVGFERNPTAGKLVVSYIMLFALLLALRRLLTMNTVSFTGIMILCWTLVSFIPFTAMVGCGNLSSRYSAFNFVYILLLITVASVSVQYPGKGLLVKCRPRVISFFLIIIGSALAISVVYISWKYTGLHINFSLSNVYDLRLEARAFAMPTFLTYVFAWSKVVNNIMLAYCMINRKKRMSILIFAIQMLSFGIDGAKSSFFMTVLTVCICAFVKSDLDARVNIVAIWGVLVLSVVGLLEYAVFNSHLIITIFIRRVLFVPIKLGDQYVDFFTTHQPDFFRSSFLRLFVDSPPYPRLSYLIGELYYGKPTMSANNGLIADAVTNLGVLGIFLMPIVLALVLRFLDSCTREIDIRMYITVAIAYSLTLTNTFLATVLLTHGLLVTFFVLLLIRSKKSAYMQHIGAHKNCKNRLPYVRSREII